ncbi:MAG: ExbD/TolR family protein [Planctomycetota bacterium]|jgi:biopolymer transport protein ExbD
MKRISLPPAARLGFTPLIDVAFLVIIFFMALPLRRLDHKLDAELPKRGSTPTVDHEPPPDIIRIHLRRQGDAVVYRLGGHTAARAAGLARVLRLLGPGNIYQIRSTPEVPWEAVVGMVDVLLAAKCTKLQFYGTRAPPRALRGMVPLPAPR